MYNLRQQIDGIKNDLNNLCDPVKLVENTINDLIDECSVAGIACLATGGNSNPTIYPNTLKDNPYIDNNDLDENYFSLDNF